MIEIELAYKPGSV